MARPPIPGTNMNGSSRLPEDNSSPTAGGSLAATGVAISSAGYVDGASGFIAANPPAGNSTGTIYPVERAECAGVDE